MDTDTFNMDGINAMGIVNAMRTGDMFLDMIIAMCIPVVLRTLFSIFTLAKAKELWEKFNKWYFKEETFVSDMNERVISHTVEKDKYDDYEPVDSDNHNEVLIKAISMYLHHLQSVVLQEANIRLTGGGSAGTSFYDVGEVRQSC